MDRVAEKTSIFLLVAAAIFNASAAVSAEVATETYRAWSTEIVTRYDGAMRIACSASSGDEDTARVMITLTGEGQGAISGLPSLFYEESAPMSRDVIVDGAVPISFEADQISGAGRMVVKRTDDEMMAFTEAYPATTAIPALLLAMHQASELTLLHEGAVMRRISLDGFADAFDAIAAACHYRN